MPLLAPVTMTVRPSCLGRSAELHLVEVTILNVDGRPCLALASRSVVEALPGRLFKITPSKVVTYDLILREDPRRT